MGCLFVVVLVAIFNKAFADQGKISTSSHLWSEIKQLKPVRISLATQVSHSNSCLAFISNQTKSNWFLDLIWVRAHEVYHRDNLHIGTSIFFVFVAWIWQPWVKMQRWRRGVIQDQFNRNFYRNSKTFLSISDVFFTRRTPVGIRRNRYDSNYASLCPVVVLFLH